MKATSPKCPLVFVRTFVLRAARKQAIKKKKKESRGQPYGKGLYKNECWSSSQIDPPILNLPCHCNEVTRTYHIWQCTLDEKLRQSAKLNATTKSAEEFPDAKKVWTLTVQHYWMRKDVHMKKLKDNYKNLDPVALWTTASKSLKWNIDTYGRKIIYTNASHLACFYWNTLI